MTAEKSAALTRFEHHCHFAADRAARKLVETIQATASRMAIEADLGFHGADLVKAAYTADVGFLIDRAEAKIAERTIAKLEQSNITPVIEDD
jgi:hypothetical protein